MNDPKPGDIWKHTNGHEYYVMAISNTDPPREGHPPDVVYLSYYRPETSKYEQIDYSKLWTRPLSDWHRSMTYVDNVQSALRKNKPQGEGNAT